ncbi:RNA polymerase sigma factor [Nocardioides alkalitolerans]|uniref:RNA polymerase sigma factor n=1 Tax=Nocardioides alkalitolerans TaxID=281714 RepID=UPI00041F08EA|nr:DUF6596 domain-containing protein [Nocardioides alkalitolerans]
MADPAIGPGQLLAALQRDEWGRLLALLVGQFRRLDLAEDGLAEAFEAGLRRWPADGVPDNPRAWLLVAARRRVLDRLRAEAVAARAVPHLEVEAELVQRSGRTMADAGETVTDERLRLVLLCTHPSLPPPHAAALTLRMVLGVSTADVARLFCVGTTTMAARLTRARKRLAGARFEVPSGPDLVGRVAGVADVAYLAFTAGYAPGSGPDVLRADVAGEALRLVRVLRALVDPDVVRRADLDALLALLLLQHSRRDARVDADGALVLLADQDRRRWHHAEIAEALALLTPVVRRTPVGAATPWLLQALVAAEHARAPTAAATDRARIADLYAELETLTGSPVVRLNRAVAVAEHEGPEAGLALLAGVDPRRLPGHRLPATRAELLGRAGDLEAAATAYAEALARCDNEAERAHLEARVSSLRRPPG